MGDHRANVKVEFTIHGKTYKQEWAWINWFPRDGECDPRITEWFESCWRDALGRYEASIWESQREQREREQEAVDRAEYERLKTKFG